MRHEQKTLTQHIVDMQGDISYESRCVVKKYGFLEMLS